MKIESLLTTQEQNGKAYYTELARIMESVRLGTVLANGHCLKEELSDAVKSNFENYVMEKLMPIVKSEARGKSISSMLDYDKQDELTEILAIMVYAVERNDKIYDSYEGLEILSALRKLYENIFPESDFGKFHSDLCMIELDCALIAIKMQDFNLAITCFETAYEHYIAHECMLSDLRDKGNVKESFTSHILEEVGDTSIPVVICRHEYFMRVVEMLPETIRTQIAGDLRYKSLFEQL